jgi:hypothetical protein
MESMTQSQTSGGLSFHHSDNPEHQPSCRMAFMATGQLE